MLAVSALGFVAAEPHRLAHFLTLTGIRAERIREAAQQPGFLAGVLDHLLADERLLIGFADSAGIDPVSVARARSALTRPWEREGP
ncbi:MAG TPA: DUF3572 domain-containing protein [Xanthobacteraceae bacterium]|jgi:hypothetical protein